ncbi:hypothetical protein [Rossellomorea marisflavi]|uniref:hypothetical protein n=1 Tax=Rossellomorea marisflavi TaxID=189381 RepID=UPI003D2F0ADD
MDKALIVSLISLAISFLALSVNISKFFIELNDRRKKRLIDEEASMKADIRIYANGNFLHIENTGRSDAEIKTFHFNDIPWEEYDGILEDQPRDLKAGHPSRSFKIHSTWSTPFPSSAEITYEDEYSRKKMTTAHKDTFEL